MEHGFQTVYWSEGVSRKSNEFCSKCDTLGNFILKCRRHVVTDETAAEYAAMNKEQKGDAKDVGGFVGGTFRDGIRAGANLEKRTMITLDLDKGQYDPDEVLTRVHRTLGEVAVIGYSSHSHTSAAPRIRLVLPLRKSMTPDECSKLTAAIIERCDLSEYADECSTRPAQLFYWPSAPKGAPTWAQHIMGPLLDASKMSVRKTVVRSGAGSVGLLAPETPRDTGDGTPLLLPDPREKPGWIGAFCRAWCPINEVIDTLLSNVYVRKGRGRYRYFDSDSEAGLIVKDGGLYAYSNHTNTDPAADGHCHNAFDLCRIHLCGGSEEKMLEYAQHDAKTVSVMFPDIEEKPEDAGNTEDTEPESGTSIKPWQEALDTMKNTYCRNTPTNARLILENDRRLAGNIHFNMLTNDLTPMPGLPWFRRVHPDETGVAQWCDADSKELAQYMADRYRMIGERSIDIASEVVARHHLFHPIRDYLNSLEWDGTPRLEKMIIDYLGSADNGCTRQMTELMMVGAVARVFEPGCKFDYMPILCGPQGCYKSTLCRVLFAPWFLDDFKFSGDKDELQRVRGIWGCEVGELAGMRKAEIQTVKGVVTRQVDIYRASYGRRAEQHPRQCIFIGTTNETYFLKDDQNRRFCLITVDPKLRTKGDDVPGALERDKDQLWAEAVALYRDKWKGRPLVLSAENAAEQERRNQGAHMDNLDPVKADLAAYLSTPLPDDWATMDKTSRRTYFERGFFPKEGALRHEFSLKAFLWEYYGCASELEAKRKDKALAGQLGNRVARYLQELGRWSDPRQKRTVYGTCKVYERLDNPYIGDADDSEL